MEHQDTRRFDMKRRVDDTCGDISVRQKSLLYFTPMVLFLIPFCKTVTPVQDPRDQHLTNAKTHCSIFQHWLNHASDNSNE